MTVKLPGNNTSEFNNGIGYKSMQPFIADLIPQISEQSTSEGYLIPFLIAYFKWIEMGGNVLDRVYSTAQLKDLLTGTVDDTFSELMRLDTAPQYPAAAAAGFKQILSTITDQYRRKGTEGAIEYFFAAVYNAQVQISYPITRRYFTGRAIVNSDNIIRFNPTDLTNSPSSYIGSRFLGTSSGAACVIQDCMLIYVNNTSYYQAVVNDVKGNFIHTEQVSVEGTPTNTVTLYSMVTNVNVTAGGSGYTAGETVSIVNHAGDNGIGFNATVGTVLGKVTAINVEAVGQGYLHPPTITVVGDGTGCTASATVSNGSITGITVTAQGSGYTYADVIITSVVTDPLPYEFAAAAATITGAINSIYLADPGVNYNAAPTVSSVPAGTGASLTATVGCVALVTGLSPQRFRGNFKADGSANSVPKQNYNIYANLGTGTGSYTPGDVVNQVDAYSNVIWQSTVVSWDPNKHDIVLAAFDITKFDTSLPINNVTHTATVWYFTGSKYTQPLYVDAGDGQVNTEYTYYITSGLAQSVYVDLLRLCVHPAGLNFISVLAQVYVVANQVGPDSVHGIDYYNPNYPNTSTFYRYTTEESTVRAIEPRLYMYLPAVLNASSFATAPLNKIWLKTSTGGVSVVSYTDPTSLSNDTPVTTGSDPTAHNNIAGDQITTDNVTL